MKRLLIVVALAVAAFVVVSELGDLTQSRPDPIRSDAATEVVLSVDEDRFGPGEDGAAAALWAICEAQTHSRETEDGELQRIGDGRYRVILRPAVGHHEQKKLVGCLEDLTVDRVVGNVESFRTFSVVVG
jgi:hypothetical protein